MNRRIHCWLWMLAITARCVHSFSSQSRRRASSVVRSSDLDDIISEVLNKPSTIKESSPKSPHELHENNGWRSIDWNATKVQHVLVARNAMEPSPVETILIEDRMVFVKRDDLLSLPGSGLSGNKARKFLALSQLHEHKEEFPHCIFSYGGPQSNAMAALAAIVDCHNRKSKQKKQHRFVYYSKTLPRFLRNSPNGNLLRALSMGMELMELPHERYSDLFGGSSGGSSKPPPDLVPPVPDDSLWVPQGGACGVSLAGTQRLAEEIWEFWEKTGRGRPLTVCLPGGTCSTAALVQNAIYRFKQQHQRQHLASSTANMDIEVVVVPCVGDEFYAQRQMMALNAELGFGCKLPTVLSPIPTGADQTYAGKQNGYFSFGEPNAQILQTFAFMKNEHQLELDLLYGAPSWTIMLRHLRHHRSDWGRGGGDGEGYFDPELPFSGRCVMYIHSGGLEGLDSQLLRYKHNGLCDGLSLSREV